MRTSLFTGSGVAIITPFTDTGVDYDALGQLIDFHLENKTDAIIVCGTTGESSTMLEREKLGVMEFAVERVNKRIPVIAGAGDNCTQDTIDRCLEVCKLGVDGLLVVTPYYNKCTQKGLAAHFLAIADAVDLPIIAYNVPYRTGVNMLPSTLATIIEHENIVGIKEASANIAQVSDMCDCCRDKASLYSGEDGIVVPTMAMGGVGVISVAANVIPRDMHDMCQAMLDGDWIKARDMQLHMNPLVAALFSEVNPIPVKTAVNLMGMNGGKLRLPLTYMEEKTLDQLKKAMKDYGIL